MKTLRQVPLAPLVWTIAAAVAAANHPEIDDPVPPGARGSVLTMAGEVRTIQGLSSEVAGRVDSLSAALKDLGATTTDTEIRIAMSADIMFDFDRADIRKEAGPSLAKVATVLKAHPGSRVTIEGHTDSIGNEAHNQPLSERRAASVRRWLERPGGVTSVTFSTRGFGATRPIAPNRKADGSDDPAARQKNRRVEIVVTTR